MDLEKKFMWLSLATDIISVILFYLIHIIIIVVLFLFESIIPLLIYSKAIAAIACMQIFTTPTLKAVCGVTADMAGTMTRMTETAASTTKRSNNHAALETRYVYGLVRYVAKPR